MTIWHDAETKPAIALKQQIERLMCQGAPTHCVLADAGNTGVDTAFRERLSELGSALCGRSCRQRHGLTSRARGPAAAGLQQ
jgi:SRSO17 transposase